MALTVTQLYEAARAGATSHTSTSFSCTAGDLLVCIYTAGGTSIDITGITDNSGSGSWTELSGQETNAHASAWWYKIANGSETTVTVSLGSSSAADMAVVKITGWSGTPTLEGTVGEDESNTVTAATATIGAGSVTNTTANAIVLAFYTADGPGNIGISRAVSDGASYTEATDGGGDEQAYLYYHVKSATGTYSPVFSFSDTGDQVYGASAVFGDVSSGHNVSATTDTLVITEQAATIGLSKNVSAGTDALVIAEQAATIGLAKNVSAGFDELVITELAASVDLGSIQNVQATTDTLVITEQAATVSLAINVQAGTDALVITEYPATLGSTQNVEATTQALLIAEQAATIGLALNVQATTQALLLTEYGATVSDASAATSRPLGLSPWVDYDTESRETRAARVQAMRERMGIVPVIERFGDESEVTGSSGEPVTRSESGTRAVLQLDRAREKRDQARLLAALEAMESRKNLEIKRRMALLLLAAEA